MNTLEYTGKESIRSSTPQTDQEDTRKKRIRSLTPWTHEEELKMRAIASIFPDIYQSPCQQGNTERFREITKLLEIHGIYKTTEQVRRVWKERLCPNIIAPSVLEKDRPAIEKLHHEHGDKWSTIALEFCEGQPSKQAFYPSNSIKNYFYCNPQGRKIHSAHKTEDAKHLPLHGKRKYSPVSISSKLSSLTDLISSSSSSDNDQLEQAEIELEAAVLSNQTHAPTFPFEIALNIQARVSQGESLKEVLQEYAHEDGYANLHNYFLFLQDTFPEILTIDITSTGKQLASIEERRKILELDIKRLRRDIATLHQGTENDLILNFLDPDSLTEDQLSFDIRDPFNEDPTRSALSYTPLSMISEEEDATSRSKLSTVEDVDEDILLSWEDF